MIDYFTQSDAYKGFQAGNKQFKEDITRLYRSLSKIDIITMVCVLYFVIRILVG